MRLRHKNCTFSTKPNLGINATLTFVEARAVVDLCLERLVSVPRGRAHLPSCLEHDVVPGELTIVA